VAILQLDATHSTGSRIFAELGRDMGALLTERARRALGVEAHEVSSYGKGAIVGAGRSLDDAAAILHPLMGKAIRSTLGRGTAIVPSTVKHGAPGTHLDVPLHGLEDEWNFSLLGSLEVMIPCAPLHEEIVLVVALGMGPFNGLAAP
jgi:hypothetical protein